MAGGTASAGSPVTTEEDTCDAPAARAATTWNSRPVASAAPHTTSADWSPATPGSATTAEGARTTSPPTGAASTPGRAPTEPTAHRGVNLAAAPAGSLQDAPQRPGGYLDPSARPDALNAPPEAPASITLPSGLEVASDLVGLLGFRHAHLVRDLVAAHIETTEDLLRLDEDGRRFTPRTGPALWRKVAAALPEGVTLGCLAPQVVEPVQLRALPGGRRSREDEIKAALDAWEAS